MYSTINCKLKQADVSGRRGLIGVGSDEGGGDICREYSHNTRMDTEEVAALKLPHDSHEACCTERANVTRRKYMSSSPGHISEQTP